MRKEFRKLLEYIFSNNSVWQDDLGMTFSNHFQQRLAPSYLRKIITNTCGSVLPKLSRDEHGKDTKV